MGAIKIGEMNRLEIVRMEPWRYLLAGGSRGEILLPNKHMTRSYKIGDEVDVFVYLDSDDKPAATTQRPLVQVNQFGYLKVVDVNPVGAFVDWGLPKHVLVPFEEQKSPMRVGEFQFVYLYLDKWSERIVATSKVDRFLKICNDDFEPGQAVDFLVYSTTDLGYKCIVNHSHFGMLYYDDVFSRPDIGQTLNGYIKQIREDQKIDLCLTLPGYGSVEAVAKRILAALDRSDGFIPLNDKSLPEDIYARFGVSKQLFKKAVGALYRERRISLEDKGIRSNDKL